MAIAFASAAAQAQGIYVVGDNREAIHLSDQPSGPSDRLLNMTGAQAHAGSAPRAVATSVGARQLEEIVRSAADANRVSAALLHAVIATESAYAVRAVSSRGAQGLMQLMPATSVDYGVTDPFDARQNVNAGARHLRHLLDQFDQNTALALAAYNAGAAAVARHGNTIPPFAETRAYVPRVLASFDRLRRQGGATTSAASP